jgi:hypothetical protein
MATDRDLGEKQCLRSDDVGACDVEFSGPLEAGKPRWGEKNRAVKKIRADPTLAPV